MPFLDTLQFSVRRERSGKFQRLFFYSAIELTVFSTSYLIEVHDMMGSNRVLVFLFTLGMLAPSAAAANDLEEIRQAKTLLWGGDQEGGGPYIFPRDDRPSEVTGYEVDIANRLAEFLKVRAQFTQAQWDKLPDMLRTRKVHVILNGYEFTDVRLDVMDATIPYYVYNLQLLGRKNDSAITSWNDLRSVHGGVKPKLGVLTSSAADTYATQFCADACEVVRYDGSTDAMREVETGKIDATLQDTPIASFYAPRFPALQEIGAPVARGYYVMYVRKGETALVKALNEAIGADAPQRRSRAHLPQVRHLGRPAAGTHYHR